MTRLNANDLVKALRAEGVKVVRVSMDGRAWPNNTTAGTFNPHGILNHHTGAGSDKALLKILWEGRPGLNGPLCHMGLGRDGTCYLVGWDNVNHAGNGDGRVAAAVLAERDLPVAKVDDTDGNPLFWAIEVMNDGVGEPYPLVQLNALVKINAAICRLSKWSEKSCIHHREWTPRKIDMSYKGPLRQHIKDCLNLPPGQWTFPGYKKPVGPNVSAALKSAQAGLKWAISAKQPGKVAMWKKVINALKSNS